MVHFGDDYQYLAFNDNGEGCNRDLTGHPVGLAHFAFVTQDISGIIKRLTDAGYKISNNGAKSAFRQKVYFLDPNGLKVKFVEYVSDLPKLRNQ